MSRWKLAGIIAGTVLASVVSTIAVLYAYLAWVFHDLN